MTMFEVALGDAGSRVPSADALQELWAATRADEVCRAALAGALRALGAPAGHVLRLEGDGGLRVAAHLGLDVAQIAELDRDSSDAHRRATQAAWQAARDADPIARALERFDPREPLTLPLIAAGEVRAVLTVLRAPVEPGAAALLSLVRAASLALAHAIEREARARAESTLRETAASFRKLAEEAYDAVVRVEAERVRDEQARAEPSETERRQREWLALVAHDLRQPLSVIAMSAGLLGRGSRRRCPEEAAANIMRSVDQIDRMVNDLAAFSQLDARRLTLQRGRVDVVELLSGMLARVDGQLLGKPIRLATPAAEPAPLSADPLRLEQVLWNLLSNAAKYSFPDSSIDVAVDIHPGEVRVAIANEGPGLAHAEQARLFQRFERLHRNQLPGVRGLGLGLYISRALVEQHGGRIWVESTPGFTTRFHVALPVEQPEEPPRARA
ncbi:MAG: HAMP domain-containing histidine kinase [Deltaproteobacteria bacterium]|nr:HAMP domain-containing histidine kinase [Deltaproteobacteria bacterium]